MNTPVVLLVLLSVLMCFRLDYFDISSTLIPTLSSLLITSVAYCSSFLRLRVFHLFSIFFLFILITLNSVLSDFSLIGYFKVLGCFCAFLFPSSICASVRSNVFDKYLQWFFCFNISFLFIESFIRFFYGHNFISLDRTFLQFSDASGFVEGGFYRFKLGSLFFLDSNFAALHAFMLLLLLLYCRVRRSSSSLMVIALLLLIILTFSRTVIICSLAFVLFSYSEPIKRLTLERFFYRIFSLGFVFLSVLYLMYLFWNLDFSLFSKFIAFSALLDPSSNTSLLGDYFGYGFDSGNFKFGASSSLSAHALVPSLLGRIGIIGASVWFFASCVCLSSFKRIEIYVILVFFILGLSLFDPFEPFFFFCCGLASAVNYYDYSA